MMLKELLLTFVLLDSIQTTVSAKYHGEECSENVRCEANTYCVLSFNNETRCLCPDDEYRSDRNQCVNIRTLVVEDVRTVKVTRNSVQLSWSSRNVNYVKAKTHIQFVGHGDLCKLANLTCEPGKSCVETPNKQYRCLCNDLQYWNKDRLCVPLTGLTVTEVQVKKVTSTSVQLSWSNRSIDKPSAAYSVSYRNKSYGAHPGGINITNLKPTEQYSFEIFVIIPNEANYKEKRGPGVSISAQTIAEDKDPNFEKKTPTLQTTTLPTETPSSSKQVLTHTTLANTASVDETSRPVPESTTLVSLISRGSELIQTKNVLNTAASELGKFKLNDSNSISLILFLLVTVSLSLLLVTSILINIILMYKRRKRHTRNRQNVYHTTNESHQETHQYFDTTHLNQSHYDEVTDLALKHYIN
ncbi:Guadeloupe Resistance Complex single-pass transmembrane protein 2 [Biomphalaria pfeifferi]|uniref:Guadeloupe Resistance Complex single-pass transmembrane protein 2 n=1 Tax=Biomphalaria pfeifferi TaxID=112525 RepID=A0AAD8B9K9_BIOPF|nr:Guadeloupe Resistance Complex single-pass transmembrane protein 2 [Biomphalaria pfeifferi]